MGRRKHTADDLLLDYAEALSLLGSARAQQLTLHQGKRAGQACDKTKYCTGRPRLLEGVWRCSQCRKAWPIEEIEIPKGGPRRSKSWKYIALAASQARRIVPEHWQYVTIADFGRILDEVEAKHPWPFIAWSIHVLAPGEVYGTEPTLGVPMDRIPCEIWHQVAEGNLERPTVQLTDYRMRQWVGTARKKTMRIVERKRTQRRIHEPAGAYY